MHDPRVYIYNIFFLTSRMVLCYNLCCTKLQATLNIYSTNAHTNMVNSIDLVCSVDIIPINNQPRDSYICCALQRHILHTSDFWAVFHVLENRYIRFRAFL